MAGTKEGRERKWREDFEEWVKTCNEVHGYRYAYDPVRVRVGGVCKVRITCPDHGEFLQVPAKHKRGQGCPVCAGNKAFDVRARLVAAFPSQAFPPVLPERSKEKFTLVCDNHGEFEVTLNQLLATKAKYGTACPKCNYERRGKDRRADKAQVLHGLQRMFPDYVFNLEGVGRLSDRCSYTCPIHGQVSGVVSELLRGHGCSECANEARSASITEVLGVPRKINVIDIWKAHGGALIPHYATVGKTHDRVRVSCVKHGAYETNLYSVKAGHGCPRCANRVSKAEVELNAWISSLGFETITQCKETLERGEVDILVPSRAVAIEFNGLYWHSEGRAGKDKHARKLDDAAKSGIRLVTIFEDEWEHKREVVKGCLRSILGVDGAKVYARLTEVVRLAWDDVKALYEEHHLQGPGTPCKDNYGLTLNGTLVAAMSFREDRFGSNDRELIRYAFTTRVVGGFSKLLKAYAATQPKGTTIVSYCDLRWFSGKSYSLAGMEYLGRTAPGYWWCKGLNRYSRVGFQKHKLKGKLDLFDEELSEEQNMVANGYWKVWDCGMGKWRYTV